MLALRGGHLAPLRQAHAVITWPAFGHRFISNGEQTETCLTCGAEYYLRTLVGSEGEYTAGNGGVPMECTGNTDMTHGEECTHLDGCACECNCVLCW